MSALKFEDIRLVLPDRVALGSVTVEDGVITAIDIKDDVTGSELEGEYLLPGLIELHTDHMEGHYAPRPGVRWNPMASIQAHDAQVSASGITTVFDALRIGMDHDANLNTADMRRLGEAVQQAQAGGRLRAEHFIHLRCEVSGETAMAGFELFEDDPLVRIASLMDHTPGQRQFVSIDQYRAYYQGRNGMTDEEFDRFVQVRLDQASKHSDRNRRDLADRCNANGIVLASHDDATLEHVEEAVAFNVQIAEFPTTIEAAQASKQAGLKVLMGAPNVVRGGSHSGNVSALDLAEQGLLDVLSSDYVPFSLLHSAFMLTERVEAISLADAVRTVSETPALAAGLTDRGAIEVGKRADLVQAAYDQEVPVVRGVWRTGQRVC